MRRGDDVDCPELTSLTLSERAFEACRSVLMASRRGEGL